MQRLTESRAVLCSVQGELHDYVAQYVRTSMASYVGCILVCAARVTALLIGVYRYSSNRCCNCGARAASRARAAINSRQYS